MLFILLNVILSTGSWQVEEFAVAKNVTLTPTIDNRIKFNTVIFTDNKECYVTNKQGQYTFNTEADAMQYWSMNIESTSVARYEERRHITTNTCNALQKNNDSFIIIITLFSTIGMFLDVSIVIWARILRKNMYRPTIIPDTQHITKLDDQPSKLNSYAAQLIAESYIRRGEICPITQTQFNTTALLVPICGHVISEVGVNGNPPSTCCLCKQPVVYTRVEVSSLSLDKSSNEIEV